MTWPIVADTSSAVYCLCLFYYTVRITELAIMDGEVVDQLLYSVNGDTGALFVLHCCI